MKLHTLTLFAGLTLVTTGVVDVADAAPAKRKPAVLFSCPGENRYEYVGFDYMRSLVKAGLAVDYIEGSAQLTWDRVKKFNVLVVLDFPAPKKGVESLFGRRPPWLDTYFAVIDRFVKAGGGLFMHYSPHYGGLAPNHLLKPWGIQFPIMFINDQRIERFTNLGHGNRCALTDQVLPSPVSEGVKLIWYPIDTHYTGAHTMPILVDKNWQVVVRAGKTAHTVVPTYDRGGIQPVPGALIPSKPIVDPVLFAIRDLPTGARLAAVQQWHPFAIGSGMKWSYNNEILSRGLAGRPSHYGRLLVNTYRWLAEPSLRTGAVGGHVTDMARLTESQLRPGAVKAFAEWVYKEEEILEYRRPPSRGKIFRGLIGAETSLGGGTGTVADYVAAARDAKLDFVVFLDDLAKLTPDKLDALRAQVSKHSTDTLQLFAGYKMHSNIGNDLFVFGMKPVWPEERVLVGPNKRTFNLQYQDESGKWARGNPALDWCIHQTRYPNTIGYYNLSNVGQGMKMYDLRVFSVAALRTYENGKQVEDMTADYLTTCQSTAVPTPVSMNIVRSPDELRQAVAANQALTYAQARTLKTIFRDALRWNCSYDGLNVFPSDGPMIRAWPRCARTMTFGAERFVTGRMLAPSPIHITSEVGLKEIRIYNGRDLFRRFVLKGQKEFATTLFLSGVVYRSMVLVAEDITGGVATSFAYRSYKEGSYVPIFCSDHVNDCGHMLLAHGPHWPGLFPATPVPNAGGTWDGGPKPMVRLLSGQFTNPRIDTSLGRVDRVPYQVPLLECGDEATTRCRMVSTRRLVKGVTGNPWSAFGPLEPSPLHDAWASHAYWRPSATGVVPNSWGGPGVIEGPFASLLTERFTFKKKMTVNQIRLFHGGWHAKSAGRSILLAVGKGADIHNVVDLTVLPDKPRQMRLDTGGWFALYSAQRCNTQILLNRGAPIVLHANPHTSYWIQIWADLKDRPVKPGDAYDAELFTMTWPMNQMLKDARHIADTVAYLDAPSGMQLVRGTRGARVGGVLDLVATDHAVELSIPRPKGEHITVPARVGPFNRRWTVGLYQVAGHRTHYYSKKDSGWAELGLDFAGRAYVPLYVSMAPTTHVKVGHPVVADAAGKDCFIQVTRINDGDAKHAPAWHVSINNPTARVVTTTLRATMDLRGLAVPKQAVTLQPGQYKAVVAGKPSGGDTAR